MGYKMKGSSFYGKNSKSPAKQLTADRMRTPEEKAFYENYEASKDYEPVPKGKVRGIGSYSKYTGPNTTKEGTFGPVSDKKTGEIVSKGVSGSNKKKVATSQKIGPVESPEMIQKKRETMQTAEDKDYFSKETAAAERAVRDARKYEKRK